MFTSSRSPRSGDQPAAAEHLERFPRPWGRSRPAEALHASWIAYGRGRDNQVALRLFGADGPDVERERRAGEVVDLRAPTRRASGPRAVDAVAAQGNPRASSGTHPRRARTRPRGTQHEPLALDPVRPPRHAARANHSRCKPGGMGRSGPVPSRLVLPTPSAVPAKEAAATANVPNRKSRFMWHLPRFRLLSIHHDPERDLAAAGWWARRAELSTVACRDTTEVQRSPHRHFHSLPRRTDNCRIAARPAPPTLSAVDCFLPVCGACV